jgi:hypothetical protein
MQIQSWITLLKYVELKQYHFINLHNNNQIVVIIIKNSTEQSSWEAKSHSVS